MSFGIAGILAALGVVTQQWVGLLFSLIGWLYSMVKRPYQVGDRVAIEDSKGDVVEVSFPVDRVKFPVSRNR